MILPPLRRVGDLTFWQALRLFLRKAAYTIRHRRQPVVCQCCGSFDGVYYRQRSHYTMERLNWVTLCPPCSQENNEHWDAMWDEYYSGCL